MNRRLFAILSVAALASLSSFASAQERCNISSTGNSCTGTTCDGQGSLPPAQQKKCGGGTVPKGAPKTNSDGTVECCY